MFCAFRLSIYSTLALACLCLGYAEGDLLPEMPIITAFVIAMIALAYRMEGRWSLSLQSANTVGGVLAIGLVGWIAFQFLRPSMGLIDALPFPANLLPYLGPVLMILVPAKLFRPKHVGDYWALQGIGVLAVTLGCAMANDLFFGVLLICYVLCFAWGLTLFHLYREIRPDDPYLAAGNSESSGRRFYLMRLAGRWSAAVLAAATLLFLITPRPSERKWELSMFSRGRLETGLSEVDLNRVGHLEQNTEIAFTVRAEDANGNPKLDLNPDQHWRAASYSHYENGRWTHDRYSEFRIEDGDRAKSQRSRSPADAAPRDFRQRRYEQLPQFGPTAYFLTFVLQHGTLGERILADPVRWRANDVAPIYVEGPKSGGVQHRADGEFEWLSNITSSGRPGYCQVVWPAPEPDLGSPFHVISGYDFLERIAPEAMEARLRSWTWGVLQQLVADGRLAAAAIGEIDPFTQCPAAVHHEAIARALGNFLSGSGEFAYSFDLVRKDKTIDPAEDFLYNTKAGHCERFASALVLTLRSIRIPAQIVVGFRGCEPQADGWYNVRSSQAHAWAEVLIARSPPANDWPRSWIGRLIAQPSMQWLSIDPTPVGEAVGAKEEDFVGWLANTRAWADSIFKNFVLSYDAHARGHAFEWVTDELGDLVVRAQSAKTSRPFVGAGLLMCIFVWLSIWRLRRGFRIVQGDRHSVPTPELWMPLHGRLMALLAKYEFRPQDGQTTQEFTADVAARLQSNEATRGAAEVPQQVAEAYYRVRFGERALSEEERQGLEAGLQRLESALVLAAPAAG